MRTVLVTGAAGYIGSEVTRRLLERGDRVRGIDNLTHGGESLLGVLNHERFTFVKGDLRNDTDVDRALEGCDCVVHLAAIVGDPACGKHPELARTVNLDASKRLFEQCSSNKVGRFVFASTCSNYGRMEEGAILDEDSPLNPISLYAETKVAFERFLMQHGGQNGLNWTILRFATAYGLSARMRFDLTVNDFVREVALDRELVVYGEQFWRPYCHVTDIARACALVLDAEPGIVSGTVMGVGDTSENYRKRMIVEEIARIVPELRVRYVAREEDPRDYRVDFSKIKRVLGFAVTKRVPDGIRETESIIKNGLLSDPWASRYVNA